jgi:hypothetical protein
MELTELKAKLLDSWSGNQEDLQEVIKLVEQDKSVFPFNDFEYLVCNLLDRKGLTFQQYLDIRSEYISANPNLWIFEISAPRSFGESFAQTYVMGKSHKLTKPTKVLDISYSGEYDLWLDGIKIEVKASRAVDSQSNSPLYVKALSRSTKKSFLMNFQQLKPQCCDVFIWVAVFRDQIVLWVLNSQDVVNHQLYSDGQHRGNHGNEGQLHINQDNIKLFKTFEAKGDNLERLIRKAAKRK